MPFIFCLIILVFFCPDVQGFGSDTVSEDRISLDDKIAQMLMVGFRGTQISSSDWLATAIKEQHIGGVILFDYDVALGKKHRNILSPLQLQKLTASLQELSSQPLFIAVDQEGGRVARLNKTNGFKSVLSHRQVSQQENRIAAATTAGAQIASMLSATGINLNLAPVVDLCVNPDNPVIAKLDRCFSNDPEEVSSTAMSFVAEHRRHQVLSALKHFPGHGSSLTDSHLGFTDISDSWSEQELIPYQQLISSGMADLVMVAHVFNRHIDENFPASISVQTIDGLLRHKLGFTGVVITDDLQMGALTKHYSFEDILLRAILAGNDILIFGNNLHYDPDVVTRAINVIKNQVENGRLSRSRIDESYRRIMKLKETL